MSDERGGVRCAGLAADFLRHLAEAVVACLVLVFALFAPRPATAGPPFRTDDPVPVEVGHWEIFGFSTGTRVRGNAAGTLAGIDANYGAAPNVQLHATVPVNFDASSGRGTRIGYGDTELGVKYRFFEGSTDGWLPQAAIYPTIDFPTGNAATNLGVGHVRAFLPLWLQKSVGDWTTFAGGSYFLNRGSGDRDFWYFGWAVERKVSKNLTLGGELFHQTADRLDGKDQTGFNFGAVYDLSENYHLMFSAGQGVQSRTTANEFSYYAALQLTF